MKRTTTRKIAILGMALWMVVGAASVAVAHYVYRYESVWDGPDGQCLLEWAETSHGDYGKGYYKNVTTARKRALYPWGYVNCEIAWERPTGWLKIHTWYMHRNSSSDSWGVCRDIGEYTNPESMYTIGRAGHWQSLPCGSGQYNTIGGGWVKYNDNWHGGKLWSGPHSSSEF